MITFLILLILPTIQLRWIIPDYYEDYYDNNIIVQKEFREPDQNHEVKEFDTSNPAETETGLHVEDDQNYEVKEFDTSNTAETETGLHVEDDQKTSLDDYLKNQRNNSKNQYNYTEMALGYNA